MIKEILNILYIFKEMFFYSCAHSHVLGTQPWLAFMRGSQLSEAVVFCSSAGFMLITGPVCS